MVQTKQEQTPQPITQEKMTSEIQQKPEKKNRGFAAMDATKQREIASKGGRAAHEKGTAHRFSSEEARAAGRRGGENSHGGGRRSSLSGG